MAEPMMRRAVYTRYGGPEVLTVDEVPRPKPGKGEVLDHRSARPESLPEFDVIIDTVGSDLGRFRKRPIIEATYPLAHIGEAHARAKTSGTVGKVVIQIV